jgi:type I restriction enzyme S subunit
MELKPGYKQTEVGTIPEGWEVKALGDMFRFSGGFTASRDQLSNEGYCYLHYGDIHKSSKAFVDVQAEYLDIPKLNVSLKRVSSRSLLKDGDVVFVDASEDDEGTSKHIVVYNEADMPYISGLHTIVAKSKTAAFDNRYKQFCFHTADIKRQFYFYAAGTKVSGISKTNIAKLFIPLPSPSEQRAIAVPLSDVDGLIFSLEKLIAKKRDLKQAAMQQLLTGQTRLPGFNGEWEVKRLGDVTDVDPENLGSDTRPEYTFNYISLEDVDSGTLNSHSELVFRTAPSRARRKLRKGDVLVSTVRPNLKSHFLFGSNEDHWVCSTGFAVVRCRERISDPGYIFFHMFGGRVSRHIDTLLTGSNYPAINSGDVRALEIPFPEYNEQTAIAAVLSDMDGEIAALEQRLAKTRALKQGMMQELLTGRTRLV